MHSLSFDKAVYSDEALTEEVEGPFNVNATTVLPRGVYFSDTEYVGKGRNRHGDLLWTVTFTYPDHVVRGEISVDTGATYE